MIGHLRCHFCDAYGVERMYLASAHVDSCHCSTCGAQWDEDRATGTFRGRGSRESVLTPREIG